jgi:hypothetical protein
MRNTVGPESFDKGSTFPFGVSRERMKKIYVDEILNQGDKSSPGPGTYVTNKWINNGRNPSFGLKLDLFA